MADRSSKLLKGLGTNRVSNTLRLRQKYNDFVINFTDGKLPAFQEWAKKNHPKVKILGG